MRLDGTDLNAESGSKLLNLEQDSNFRRFHLKSSCSRRHCGDAMGGLARLTKGQRRTYRRAPRITPTARAAMIPPAKRKGRIPAGTMWVRSPIAQRATAASAVAFSHRSV